MARAVPPPPVPLQGHQDLELQNTEQTGVPELLRDLWWHSRRISQFVTLERFVWRRARCSMS